jgi:hypothetical protein
LGSNEKKSGMLRSCHEIHEIQLTMWKPTINVQRVLNQFPIHFNYGRFKLQHALFSRQDL